MHFIEVYGDAFEQGHKGFEHPWPSRNEQRALPDSLVRFPAGRTARRLKTWQLLSGRACTQGGLADRNPWCSKAGKLGLTSSSSQ